MTAIVEKKPGEFELINYEDFRISQGAEDLRAIRGLEIGGEKLPEPRLVA